MRCVPSAGMPDLRRCLLGQRGSKRGGARLRRRALPRSQSTDRRRLSVQSLSRSYAPRRAAPGPVRATSNRRVRLRRPCRSLQVGRTSVWRARGRATPGMLARHPRPDLEKWACCFPCCGVVEEVRVSSPGRFAVVVVAGQVRCFGRAGAQPRQRIVLAGPRAVVSRTLPARRIARSRRQRRRAPR